jgi:hypothetical protein
VDVRAGAENRITAGRWELKRMHKQDSEHLLLVERTRSDLLFGHFLYENLIKFATYDSGNDGFLLAQTVLFFSALILLHISSVERGTFEA